MASGVKGNTYNTIWGSYRLSSTQGYRTAPTSGASTNHHGTDWAMPQGTSITPVTGGTVTAVKYPTSSALAYVYVTDSSGNVHEYLHLSKINVSVGDTVTTNTVIGLSGGAKGSLGSGPSTGSHLDYRVKDASGNWLDSFTWATGGGSDSGTYTESLSGGSGGTVATGSTSEGIISNIVTFLVVLLVLVAAVYLFIKAFGGSPLDMIPQVKAIKEVGKEVANNG